MGEESTVCPACHGQGRRIWAASVDEAARHYVSPAKDPSRFSSLVDHLRSIWGEGCEVRRCSHCGLCFAVPFIAGDHRFYTLAYERSSYPQDKWEYRRTREAMRSIPIEGALLDVGAGDGAFLRLVSPELVPRESAKATEFSEYGVAKIRSDGFECWQTDVRALGPEHDGRYGVVGMFQVLEHMDRLDELFETLSRISLPSAHLFIAVPGYQRISFNEERGGLLDMPPNHVTRWTKAALEALAGRHAWRVIEHEVERSTARDAVNLAQYRFLRKAQRRSLSQVANDLGNRVGRKVLKAACVGGELAASLPAAVRLARGDLGDSQWAHLVRAE